MNGDASEVFRMAADLSMVGAKSVPVVREVMAEIGSAFAHEWAANARETSGDAAKYYPDSIDSELAFDVTGVSVVVGPNKAKKQGPLGHLLEFGTETSPPHLDGLRALDGMQVRAERMMDSAIGHLFG